jgi:hypothetical protein
MSSTASEGLADLAVDYRPMLIGPGQIETARDAPSSRIFGANQEVVCEGLTKGPSPVPEMVMGQAKSQAWLASNGSIVSKAAALGDRLRLRLPVMLAYIFVEIHAGIEVLSEAEGCKIDWIDCWDRGGNHCLSSGEGLPSAEVSWTNSCSAGYLS